MIYHNFIIVEFINYRRYIKFKQQTGLFIPLAISFLFYLTLFLIFVNFIVLIMKNPYEVKN
jgi:hypothetical protein